MYFVHISKGGKYMNTKILLITNKGYSPIFNNVKECVWFLYNTKYIRRLSIPDLRNFSNTIYNRINGNTKCTTPLPLSYTRNIPVYVIPLDDYECKLFEKLCYTSNSQS